MRTLPLKKIYFIILLFMIFNSCKHEPIRVDVDKMIDYCNMQTERSLNELKINNKYDYNYTPHSVVKGNIYWLCHKINPQIWTSGYWAGILWLDYSQSKNKERLADAQNYTAALKSLLDYNFPYDHNIGFQFITSYGNGYKIDRNNKEYADILVEAAQLMSKLYNNKTGSFISSPDDGAKYNWHQATSIGNIASLELMFLATEISNDSAYYKMACSHIDNVIRDNFSIDNSICEIAIYDTVTGNFINKTTIKGYDEMSIWSRGQAWTIYGQIKILDSKNFIAKLL